MPQRATAEPGFRPYGEGIYRRRIRLRARGNVVVGDLEDDFQCFRVTLEHDGRRVTDVVGEARRTPWSTCPGATSVLSALRGMPLSRDCRAVDDHANRRSGCTHLFDLAGLAVAHATASRERRQYDIEVPDRVDGRTRPRLHCDGELLLQWQLDGQQIAGPKRFEGRTLRGSAFYEWVREELDGELIEAAITLRRATIIAIGRATSLDRIAEAKVLLRSIEGSCHTFTAGIAESAARVVGSTLEFTDAPERLLADVSA